MISESNQSQQYSTTQNPYVWIYSHLPLADNPAQSISIGLGLLCAIGITCYGLSFRRKQNHLKLMTDFHQIWQNIILSDEGFFIENNYAKKIGLESQKQKIYFIQSTITDTEIGKLDKKVHLLFFDRLRFYNLSQNKNLKNAANKALTDVIHKFLPNLYTHKNLTDCFKENNQSEMMLVYILSTLCHNIQKCRTNTEIYEFITDIQNDYNNMPETEKLVINQDVYSHNKTNRIQLGQISTWLVTGLSAAWLLFTHDKSGTYGGLLGALILAGLTELYRQHHIQQETKKIYTSQEYVSNMTSSFKSNSIYLTETVHKISSEEFLRIKLKTLSEIHNEMNDPNLESAKDLIRLLKKKLFTRPQLKNVYNGLYNGLNLQSCMYQYGLKATTQTALTLDCINQINTECSNWDVRDIQIFYHNLLHDTLLEYKQAQNEAETDLSTTELSSEKQKNIQSYSNEKIKELTTQRHIRVNTEMPLHPFIIQTLQNYQKISKSQTQKN